MNIKAELIECPGRVKDASFTALEITVEGFVSPLHLVLALPTVAVHALAEQIDPRALYKEISDRINKGQ